MHLFRLMFGLHDNRFRTLTWMASCSDAISDAIYLRGDGGGYKQQVTIDDEAFAWLLENQSEIDCLGGSGDALDRSGLDK